MINDGIVHLYNDLAWLWPLWGDPMTNYADWCNRITQLIQRFSRRDAQTLLNLGCGGGKNIFTLKHKFEVTGVDISPAMLDLAKQLNPECNFLLGDMRNCSLGQEFDAVLVDDAISYMVSHAELSAVFQNAYRHLRVGGVMIVEPDYTKDTFEQNRTRVSYANAKCKPANVDVTFIENNFDPDPGNNTFEDTIIYLIREKGKLRIEKDISEFGLFTRDEWRAALCEVGYEVREEACTVEQNSRMFVCVKIKQKYYRAHANSTVPNAGST